MWIFIIEKQMYFSIVILHIKKKNKLVIFEKNITIFDKEKYEIRVVKNILKRNLKKNLNKGIK